MQLKSIEIQGFKSFALKTRLDFDAGMTAVVGPNGSGKSNLAEAIRWVLGEQSNKQLRGKASTDVIFAGSENKVQSPRAIVRLIFENESGRFPVDAAEVAVARSLSRSGESEYTVNGDPVRLIDLQHMLAEAGIGAKTYTVISQGMVDRYLSATPAARRELFDEATGIRAMQIKLHEAEKKIRATQHHAQEIETVIHELEPRLAVLGRQIQRHNERQDLEKVFYDKQSTWFEHTWHEFSHDLEIAQIHGRELDEQIAQARALRQAYEQRLLSASASPHNSVLQEKIHQARAHYEAATQEYIRITQERERLDASVKDVQQKRKAAEQALEEKRGQSLYFDWLKTTRQLLRRAQDLLQQVMNGASSDRTNIEALVDEINTTLDRTDDSMSVSMARSVLTQLEKPLQEAARLQAIEQERKAQLKALIVPVKPSASEVELLERQLAVQAAVDTSATLPEELEAAREKELMAEREAGAARVAIQQANQALHGLEQEILRERGTKFLQVVQHQPPTNPKPSDQEIRQLSGRISQLGTIDELTLKEYDEVKQRYDHLTHQLQDIRDTERNIQELQARLRQEMNQLFTQQFAVIQRSFSTYFLTLFGGGKASLTLSEEGIEIEAIPPHKRARHISLLSGGERALTSLALLLAILEAQRPPFVVLDEVDAALDEANSKNLSETLRDKSKHTQFIVITHNRQTMSVADVLYGVTMLQDGISKIYSVSMKEIEELVEPAPQNQRMNV
ncbi:MAG: AAA family ATPase [Candidatus Andersenbacteria bacterium]